MDSFRNIFQFICTRFNKARFWKWPPPPHSTLCWPWKITVYPFFNLQLKHAGIVLLFNYSTNISNEAWIKISELQVWNFKTILLKCFAPYILPYPLWETSVISDLLTQTAKRQKDRKIKGQKDRETETERQKAWKVRKSKIETERERERFRKPVRLHDRKNRSQRERKWEKDRETEKEREIQKKRDI